MPDEVLAIDNWWLRLRRRLGVFVLIRFSLLMAAIGLAMVFVDQGKEVLIAMAAAPFSEPAEAARKAAFVVATVFCAFSAWYTARVMLQFRFDLPASSSSCCRKLKKHLPRWLGAAFLLLVAVALLAADRRNVWLALILAAVTVMFLYFVYKRRDWFNFEALPPEGADLASVRQLPRLTRIILAIALVLNLVFMIVCAYGYRWFGQSLGTATVVLFAMSLMIPMGSALVYLGNRFRIPVIGILVVLAILFSPFNDNHRVRQTADMRSYEPAAKAISRFRSERAEPVRRPLDSYSNLESYFTEWVRELEGRHGSSAVPVVFVAAEGGGIRAAYWTASVLSHLQDVADRQGVDFARHVFAISGVSGGSLGAAVFAALRKTPYGEDPEGTDAPCTTDPENRHLCRAQRILARDFLAPTVTALLFPDLLQRFLPVAFLDDRAMALETSWEEAWWRYEPDDRFAGAFDDLWTHGSGDDPFGVPLLFLNSTVVETGQRIIVNPIGFGPDDFGRTFHDAHDAAAVIGAQVPLSTAVHMSARFTYVSPAGTIERRDADRASDELDWIRVVDGGYFENSGAVTLAEIMLAVKRQAADMKVRIRPVVLHISNEPLKRAGKVKEEAPGKRVFLGEVLSPVRALLHVRPARGFQAREVLSARVTQSPDQPDGGLYVHFRLCDYGVMLPLGWMLSKPAQADMTFQLTGYPGGLPPSAPNATLLNPVNLARVVELLADRTPPEAPDMHCWNGQ